MYYVQDTWIGPFTPATMQMFCDSAPASAAYSAANRAFYYPVRVTRPLIVYQAYNVNGATASGAIDIGLYDRVGTRITSTGSQAQTGTNASQTFELTDTLIGPGLFYVAIAMDNTTGTVFSRTENTAFMRFMGMFNQANAFPLPATATFATAASGRIILFGVTTRPVL